MLIISFPISRSNGKDRKAKKQTVLDRKVVTSGPFLSLARTPSNTFPAKSRLYGNTERRYQELQVAVPFASYLVTTRICFGQTCFLVKMGEEEEKILGVLDQEEF